VGRQIAGLRHWLGTNIVPLVLVPLAAVLVWVAIWKVWLPEPGAGSPSRRSVTLALVLLVLGVGAAVIGLFHDRIGSVKLDRTGFEITLTKAQQAGAQELVAALGERNAPAAAYVAGLQRYLSQLPANGHVRAAVAQPQEPYKALARSIADDLAPG
jgi:hypothetical protein